MASKNKKIINFEVIVLGAGLAGLSCADELAVNSDKTILILEKNACVGGLASTYKYKNIRYDLAPHRWYTKNDFLNKWLEDLVGKDLLTVRRYTPIYQFNKLFNYPIEFLDVLKKVGLSKAFKILFSYLKSKILKKKVVNMQDAYINRFGEELFNDFNKDYNEKLWGENSCKKMSSDFVDQRVKNLSLFSIILDIFRVKRNNVISLVSKFVYPKYGVGQISEKILSRYISNGGEIKFNVDILNIKRSDGLYFIETAEEIYSCNNLVSSVPIDVFMKYFKNLSQKFLKYLSKLKYIKQKVVVLIVKSKKITNFTWVYVHPKDILTFRFMEMKNWSKSMSSKNTTSLIFEYPFLHNTKISKLSDLELVNITINDFEKYFNKNRKIKVIHSIVHLVENAYPVYDLYYKKNLVRIKKYIDKMINIQLIGRNGMFRYNNMDHSILTGIYAARNILAGKKVYDLELINNEADYLEEIKKK